MATPSEILRKTKKSEAAEDKGTDKTSKKDEKTESKGNAMLNWIAKNKKTSKD